MSDTHTLDTAPTSQHHDHMGHHRMMAACALITVALVVTEVVSPGFVLAAAACIGMVATIMWAMSPPEH